VIFSKAYKLILLLLAISFFIVSLKSIFPQPAAQKLNILLITIDTLRADHVGIYGGQVETPAIDRLGRLGVIFTHAYCHVPLTLPSHCSLLTGVIPPVHGVRDNGYRFQGGNQTLAEILKTRGYATAAFVGAFPLDSRFGLDRGFDVYDDNYGSRNPQRDLTFIERKAEEVNTRALIWLEKNKNKNFFLWIHYFDPHAPYEPPPPFKEKYEGREYDGEIAYTDLMIGHLIAKMEEWSLIDNTLIVLTADHGEGLGEHQEKTHGIFIYDATMHVPLIFFNKKILPQGRVIQELAGLSDVFPTILDLLNIPFDSRRIQGKSLKSSLLKGKEEKDKEIYLESVAAMLDRNWAPLQGLRTKNWKYIEAPIPELYDLNEDPLELNNIYEKYPKVALELQRKMKTMLNKTFIPSLAEIKRPEMDKEVQEKLRSLGYISGGGVICSEPQPDPKIMIEIDNLFNDAIMASESGKLVEACQLYQKLLEKQPNFALAYEYAAYNFYKMGKLTEAISLLEQALSRSLRTKSIKARLGLYLQETGQIKESIDLLKEALEQDPTYTEAYNYLGVSYYKNNQMDLAEATFKKALELDRDYAMTMNNLGNVYLTQKKYDEAIKEYNRAIETDPLLASAYNGLGVAFYRQGKINEALEQWQKALIIDPYQADVAYNLGRLWLRLGNKEKALEFLEHFLKVAQPIKYAQDIEEVQQAVEKLKRELRKNP
jgi:arylsulfatase A-like enzyme/Tfp pilus assembly protein PilF